ncbi:MAG: hypothetical protein U0165_01710 [Polyangiaceae bacterium]
MAAKRTAKSSSSQGSTNRNAGSTSSKANSATTITADLDAALSTALEAHQSGNREDLLAALLSAWRLRRLPELAAMIDGLTVELGGVPIYPIDASREDRIKAWDKIAVSPNEVDVGRLALVIVDGVRSTDTAQRIARFAALPPDPRIALAYQKMIASPPWTASSNGKIWTAFFDQLTGLHADPRAIGMIRAIEGRYLDIFGRSVMGEKIQKSIGNVASTLEKLFPPGSLELEGRSKELLDELLSKVKVRVTTATVVAPQATPPPMMTSGRLDTPDAWMAHIAEAPDDDDRIDAFAKWLSSKGSPRAHFIELQMRRHRGMAVSPQEERHEQALIKKFQKEWLGAVSFAVPGFPQTFERGMLSRCHISLRGKFATQAVGHPAWATVKRVQLPYGKETMFLIGHPIFKSLRVVDYCDEQTFLGLASSRIARPIESVTMAAGPHPDDLPETFDAPGLPNLRRFSLNNQARRLESLSKGRSGRNDYDEAEPERYIPFLKSPFVQRLEQLEIQNYRQNILGWLKLAQEHLPQRTNLVLTVGGYKLTKAPSGSYSELSIMLEARYTWGFLRNFEGFDPSGYTRIEFVHSGSFSEAKPEHKAELDKVIEHCAKTCETTLREARPDEIEREES